MHDAFLLFNGGKCKYVIWVYAAFGNVDGVKHTLIKRPLTNEFSGLRGGKILKICGVGLDKQNHEK